MRTVSFCTLGCKVNQYETESLKELLIENGYKVLDFDEVCDLYVINSCTVTATADKKTRQMIARAKRANHEGIIALLGCMAEKLTEEVVDNCFKFNFTTGVICQYVLAN